MPCRFPQFASPHPAPGSRQASASPRPLPGPRFDANRPGWCRPSPAVSPLLKASLQPTAAMSATGPVRLCLRRAMFRHGRMRMSHKCGGPSCYRKQGRRKECPWCNRARERATLKRRWRREFDRKSKSNHWATSRYTRLGERGLTREIIMETLEYPDYEIESGWKGKNQSFYKFYPPNTPEAKSADRAKGGAWFRVVLDDTGALLTAFRDDKTEGRGGLICLLTPATTANIQPAI